MDYKIIYANTDLTAIDLNQEIVELKAAGTPYETATAEIDGKPERAQILFVPSAGRGGVAWGANADWSDAASIEDLIERYCRTPPALRT